MGSCQHFSSLARSILSKGSHQGQKMHQNQTNSACVGGVLDLLALLSLWSSKNISSFHVCFSCCGFTVWSFHPTASWMILEAFGRDRDFPCFWSKGRKALGLMGRCSDVSWANCCSAPFLNVYYWESFCGEVSSQQVVVQRPHVPLQDTNKPQDRKCLPKGCLTAHQATFVDKITLGSLVGFSGDLAALHNVQNLR